MRLIHPAALAAAVLAAAFAVGTSCFSPEQPDCTFRCDDSVENDHHCPDGYGCQADGYCHRNGTTGSCPYSAIPDASVVAAADLSVLADLSALDSAPAADLVLVCHDGVVNGDETDVDCGGSCGPCGEGKICLRAADCASMICQPLDGGMARCAATPDLAGTD